MASLEELLAQEATSVLAGRFEWVDGALTRAILSGGWVLLDNANMVNPTVLDRLNPLLEPGGVLYLNECGHSAGGPRVISPHPDFRLFLALDPAHGEVSRAMRNRGVELALLQPSPMMLQPPPMMHGGGPSGTGAAAAASGSAHGVVCHEGESDALEGVRDMELMLASEGVVGAGGAGASERH